jgi:chromate transporter
MLPSSSRPSCAALFLGFLGVGVCGFGGVLPWARRMIVEQRQWMSAAEFTDLLSLCQFLPGPNVINVSVALGARFRGVRGAIAAFVGLMVAPMAIVIALALLYERFGHYPTVRNAFVGLAAAASALVLATSLKISAPLKSQPIGIAIALATVAAIAIARWPLVIVLLVMAPLSIALLRRAHL